MKYLLAISLAIAGSAAAVGGEVHGDYERDVKPILRARCYACHGAMKQESGLRLDTAAFIRAGGDSGEAVTAGQSDGSLLVARITATDEGSRMPPEGPPVTPEQIAIIKKWIELGAAGPENEEPEQHPRDHWAFRQPVRAEVPASPTLEAERFANSVDAFMGVRRHAAGVPPLPAADKTTLLRRVYLDLIGIPPLADELRDFTQDDSPTAYEEVVDRLLASPMYGERWGRHWMDVWRYSDWYGRRAVPDVMNSYPMIWRWRDWIVESLNADKGYDRMVVEMLAADELSPADDINIVATGYLVRSWFKWNYETWKKDLVEHTGKAFLGLTMNCCQCHDHKYDPLSQEEYFRFRAFFEPLELRHDRVPGEPDPGPFEKYIYGKPYGPIHSGMVRVFDEQLTAETYMFAKGDSRLRLEGKAPVTAATPAVLGGGGLTATPITLPLTVAYPGLKPVIQAEERARRRAAVADAELGLERAGTQLSAAAAVTAARHAASAVTFDPGVQVAVTRLATTQHDLGLPLATVAAAEARLAAAQAELASYEQRAEADATRYSTGRLSEDRKGESAVLALIHGACQGERAAAVATAQASLAASQLAIAQAEAQAADAAGRGDKTAADAAAKALLAAQQGQAAAATSLQAAQANLALELGEYTPLSPKYPQISTGRRAVLAQWIGHRDNPLTARVAINHIWLRHFGQAIVETTHDFGRNGSRPAHPEVLDWLACELMDAQWSMKHVHRLLVMSETYRLASGLPRSSGPASEAVLTAQRLDPDNRTYWHAPANRMQAEVVRDSLLAVAGELDATMGGHELDHRLGLTSRRRSLYFAHHGEEKMEFLELFDAPSALECYKRTSSVQPQQALALTNSELTTTLSRHLAQRLWLQLASEPADNSPDFRAVFVRRAFAQILNREPRAAELAASLAFLQEQATRLTAVDGAAAAVVPAERARENLVHALMNHHEFVTIR